MPRGVTKAAVPIDPVAAWLTEPVDQEGISSPSYDKPAHEYGQPFGDQDGEDPPAQDNPGQEEPVPELCISGHLCGPGAKFCPECGVSLAVAPPAPWDCGSGHDNPAEAKFCTQCGAERPIVSAPVAGAGALAELASRVSRSTAAEEFRPTEPATPQEQAAKERAHLAAIQAGKQETQPRYAPQPPCTCNCHRTGRPPGLAWPCEECGAILVHMVKDGLTFAGVVWMRGQEVEIHPAHPRYDDAKLWMLMDDFAQMERWEELRFRTGPWPGRRSYTDGAESFERLRDLGGDYKQAALVGPPDMSVLARADQMERQRGRRVPLPSG